MRFSWILFLILPFCAQAQLSGPIQDSGRKLQVPFDFTITGHKTGYFYFNIGVSPDGVVKLCEYDAINSTLVSTPLMVKAKNHILANLRFEAGAGFPDLHSGSVIIEVTLQSKS